MAAKRGPTAFFIFSEEQREATRAECLAAAEPGAKVSVATVAKAIGEKWRGLSDEDKAGYKEKAAQRAAESAAQAEAADADRGAADGAGEEGGEAGPSQEQTAAAGDDAKEQQQHQLHNPFGFPLSLVKRIMCMDPDVGRISGDGLKAVAKATELLLEHMAVKAAAAARGAKRKTVKFSDVERAVRGDARLVEAGLKEVLAEDMFQEARQGPLRNGANKANAGGGGDAAGEVPGCERAAAKAHSGKKKARREEEEGQKGLRPITDFFSAGQAAAAAAAAAATAGADEPENLAEDSP